MVVTGVIGFYSKNWLPEEVRMHIDNKGHQEEKTKALISTEPSTAESDKLTLETLINIILQTPRFIVLIGSKLFFPEEPAKNESNIFSLVKRTNLAES